MPAHHRLQAKVRQQSGCKITAEPDTFDIVALAAGLGAGAASEASSAQCSSQCVDDAVHRWSQRRVVIGARRRSAAAVRHRGRAGRGRVRADGPSGWGDRVATAPSSRSPADRPGTGRDPDPAGAAPARPATTRGLDVQTQHQAVQDRCRPHTQPLQRGGETARRRSEVAIGELAPDRPASQLTFTRSPRPARPDATATDEQRSIQHRAEHLRRLAVGLRAAWAFGCRRGCPNRDGPPRSEFGQLRRTSVADSGPPLESATKG